MNYLASVTLVATDRHAARELVIRRRETVR